MGQDKGILRLIVILLGAIALAVVLGGIWLAWNDKSLTDALISMGSTALGGLSGFLAASLAATHAAGRNEALSEVAELGRQMPQPALPTLVARPHEEPDA